MRQQYIITTPNGKTTLFGKYYTQCGGTQRLSVLCSPEIAAQSFTVFLQKNAVKNLSHADRKTSNIVMIKA